MVRRRGRAAPRAAARTDLPGEALHALDDAHPGCHQGPGGARFRPRPVRRAPPGRGGRPPPGEHGRFVLEVEGGTARVRPGGEGRLKLHVRALAPLYTGFLTPRALQLAGMLTGDDASLDAASALFSGPAPSLRDMF
ncbi:sterol carrier protein domain-containing protein [Corallococcus sp. CA049B]|uniref:sterol carrier protein domain-containing protein n=1 Tax=Corallococcus sp. CA049B TaxID=2316730 RepID=UPI003558070E